MDNTNPNMVRVLMVNPSGMNNKKQLIKDTGIARIGMIAERQF